VTDLDAHDPAALLAAAQRPHAHKPQVILGRSDPCHGLPVLRERAPKLHYVRFRDEAERQRYADALAAMGGD
jgi:transketolase